MTTLNVSMPESMRKYVEAQAAEGEFTASEYIRHLIRIDQERKTLEKRAKIAQYLALCEQQIAMGKVSTLSMKEMQAKFEREYKKSGAAKKSRAKK